MSIRKKIIDLRENRFSKYISATKASKLLNVSSRQSYDRYENGEVSIPIKLITEASKFYKVSPNYFLDDCYGNNVYLAPYVIGYNEEKGRLIFEDLEIKSEEIQFSKDYFATNFFFIEIQKHAIHEFDFFKFATLQNYYLKFAVKNRKITKEIIPFSEIASLCELDNKTVDPILLMMKCKAGDISFDHSPNIYLIYLKREKRLCLSYIKKCSNHYSILPFYDVVSKEILGNYPFLDDNGTIGSINDGALNDEDPSIKVFQLKDFEVLAKTINIWDPKSII